MKITWLGHASFKIESMEGFLIYIDPHAGEEEHYSRDADLILISHEGYHHLGQEHIRKISSDKTVVLASKQAAYEVNGTVINAGEVIEVGAAKVKAVESYNAKQGIERGTAAGFLISMEGKIIYFADSSELIPEMSEIACDIMLIPVSTSTTMSPRDAARAVKEIRPKLAIPMHYGTHGGHLDEVELFKELAESETNCNILILKEGEEIEL